MTIAAIQQSSGHLGAAVVRLLRFHQWIKNGVVFAPLFFSGGLANLHEILQSVIAVVAFCLLSSAIYVFNDLCDLEADRQHKKKCTRPLASGAIGIPLAWGLICALVSAAIAFLSVAGTTWRVALVLGIYVAINIAYSTGLKRVALLELFIVAAGFVLRLLAGGFAIDVELTTWILICTALVSLLIVVGKRRADLTQENDPLYQRVALRSYNREFLDRLITMIGSATLVAYLLFCASPYGYERYGNWAIFTGAFVAFGVFRFVQIVTLENGGDAPTLLVVEDACLRWTVLSWIAVFGFIIYLH